MIKLSNGHVLDYVVASGALGFKGKGWLWERPLVFLGLIKPEDFTVVIKTLTLKERKGNLRWYKPWACIKPIKGGTINKVGLTNKGADWWAKKIAPKINFEKYKIIVSIHGKREELVEIVMKLDHFPFVAYEVNGSCPNSGNPLADVKSVVEDINAVKRTTKKPIIAKLSVTQNCVAIANELTGIVEAISLNSIPWEKVYPDKKTPLHRLEKKVGGGGGGVSGKPAQVLNWGMVSDLCRHSSIPIIAPSVMEYKDLEVVANLGAKAVSFGAVHLPDSSWWYKPWTLFSNPCKP